MKSRQHSGCPRCVNVGSVAPALGDDAETALPRVAHDDDERDGFRERRELAGGIHDELFEGFVPAVHHFRHQTERALRVIAEPLIALHERHVARPEHVQCILDKS